MTESISNKGNEHRWKKWQERCGRGLNFARGGTCDGREGTGRLAGCPTSAGETGALWKCWRRARARNRTHDGCMSDSSCSEKQASVQN